MGQIEQCRKKGRIERNLASMIPDSGSEESWTDRHGLDEFCFAWYSI